MLATCGFSGASPEEPDGGSQNGNGWRVGPRIGFSAHTGIIGIEAQHRHIAFAAGLPGNIGLKYYIRPEGPSWFMGGHYIHFKSETSDFQYAPGYEGDTTWTEGGLDGGYRWRWGSGWDLSLSLALLSAEKKERSGPAVRTTRYFGIRPSIAFGYSF